MYVFSLIVFWLSLFIIFWAMIGYPLSLNLLDKFFPNKKNRKNADLEPTVTIMIVAHNEEKVIEDKLQNVLAIDYPKNKMDILVASDNSTDRTNEIIEDFITKNPQRKIKLYKVQERMGKTNAQNEAQKLVNTEYLVMTDANSMIDKMAIKELMSSFIDESIRYVCGKLVYINEKQSNVSDSESEYWNLDIQMRDVESRFQTITAGNGALYACRTKDYIDVDPIQSHDTAMPLHFSLANKRAIMNSNALVFEKAGETVTDEFGRRVRMNRILLDHILPDINILNVFKYKWYTYFYLGHRTSRYLLWISHLLLFISSLYLAASPSVFYTLIVIGQVVFYLLAILQSRLNIDNKLLNLISHYGMAIFAQWVAVYKILTGQSKPFWDKAESTR